MIMKKYKNKYFNVTDPVIPWYYYVPREGIENERSEPNSVRRLPASKLFKYFCRLSYRTVALLVIDLQENTT